MAQIVVRNLPDGAVELVAQGPRKDVETLVSECKSGPSGSRVDGIAITWPSPAPSYNTFEIRG